MLNFFKNLSYFVLIYVENLSRYFAAICCIYKNYYKFCKIYQNIKLFCQRPILKKNINLNTLQ